MTEEDAGIWRDGADDLKPPKESSRKKKNKCLTSFLLENLQALVKLKMLNIFSSPVYLPVCVL